MNKRANIFITVFTFNLIISLFYFFDGLNYNYSNLSTDLHNIIPIVQKLDNPELFQEDLFLDDIKNVKYYTPFFVKGLHYISSLVNQNYILALNILNSICHLLYGLLWFYFFYKFSKNLWLSFIFSLLIKGIIWLPGFEFWGISDLGLLLPRTVYFSLLPIPFLIIREYTIFSLAVSSFLIGLIFNFHPISGLGGILLFLIFVVFTNTKLESHKLKLGKSTLILILALLLGMLPFMLTYFGGTNSEVNYDLNLYKMAFNERISLKFSSPSYYLKEWLKYKYLFFYIPFIIYSLVSLKDLTERKKAKILLISVSSLLILPNTSVYIESVINNIFDTNFRMSFQLIRIQKLVIIPYYISMFFLFKYILKKYSYLKRNLSKIAVLFVVSLMICNLNFFDKVPFMGDDIFRTVLPLNMSFNTNKIETIDNRDKMAKLVEEKTTINDAIYGSHFYRVASKRSVVLDFKGASMLIEGNPEKLIQWHQKRNTLDSIEDAEQKIDYIKSLGATHLVSELNFHFLKILHREGNLYLYSL